MCFTKEVFFSILQKTRVSDYVLNKVKLAILFKKDSDTGVFL